MEGLNLPCQNNLQLYINVYTAMYVAEKTHHISEPHGRKHNYLRKALLECNTKFQMIN